MQAGQSEFFRAPAELAGARREWQYRQPVVALVTRGHFGYQTDRDRIWAATGAVIAGNVGDTFIADHIAANGHSRIAIFLDEAIMLEVAAALGSDQPTFAAAALAPGKFSVLPSAWIRRIANDPSPDTAFLFSLVSNLMKPTRLQVRMSPIKSVEVRRLHEAIRQVHENVGGSWTLSRLASISGMSRYHFIRRFHQLVGATPGQYLLYVRMTAAAEQLASSKEPIVQVALGTGFEDLSTFYRQFRARFGMTPAQWRYQNL